MVNLKWVSNNNQLVMDSNQSLWKNLKDSKTMVPVNCGVPLLIPHGVAFLAKLKVSIVGSLMVEEKKLQEILWLLRVNDLLHVQMVAHHRASRTMVSVNCGVPLQTHHGVAFLAKLEAINAGSLIVAERK